MNDGKTKRIMSYERDALIYLHAIEDIVRRQLPKLNDRIKETGVKNAAQRMGLIRWCATTLDEDMINTVPEEQKPLLQKEIDMSSYAIGVKTASQIMSRDTDFGTVISWKMLDELVGHITNEKCMLCDMDIQQQRSCKLRKLLNSIPNDMEDRKDKSCPYRWL